MRAFIPSNSGMSARALAIVGESSVIEIGKTDRQRLYLQKGRDRCNWFADHPEKFPELYGDVRKRWPDRRAREKNAKIAACLFRHHDLVDHRVGMPRSDGSVWGLSLKRIAIETGLGDPNERQGKRDWKGRRAISRRLRAFHDAGYLAGGKTRQVHVFVRRSRQYPAGRAMRWAPAGNPRWRVPESYVTKGGERRYCRLPGSYVNLPTVRIVGVPLLNRLELEHEASDEAEKAKKYRQTIGPGRFVDVQLRRARDRLIKLRQRSNKAREQRLYYAEERQLMAARTVKRTE